MIDAENAPWIPQAPLNLHHKSVLSSKKIDGFWWWKIENAQKLNLLFVKKIICSTGPFEAISRKLYSPLGSASTGGVEKFPKKSGAKKMTLTAWGCRVLVESGRLWHPGLEAISTAGGKIWRVENVFFGDIWSLKTPTMLKKSHGFGDSQWAMKSKWNPP